MTTAPVHAPPPTIDPDTPVTCSLTGRTLRAGDAYWAPPLITAGELFGTIFRTALTRPGALGAVLAVDMPDVPYAPDAREQLAARRSTEQAKFLLVVLVVLAVILAPIIYLLVR